MLINIGRLAHHLLFLFTVRLLHLQLYGKVRLIVSGSDMTMTTPDQRRSNMKKTKYYLWVVTAFCLILLTACGGGSSSSGDRGTLSLGLSDAPTNAYKTVYVTIDEVQVHHGNVAEDNSGGNNWITVATPRKTYNLLDLINGRVEQLGIVDLEPGIYTQIRLYLGLDPDDESNLLGEPHPFANYVVDEDDDEIHQLKVPSGYQSGIKLVSDFEVVAGSTLNLFLDFDAAASVVTAGNSGRYLLKPVIKVVDTMDDAIVSGTITGPGNIEGVKISAQIYHPRAIDEKDKIEIYSSTITDETGSYLMYLAPGNYNIIAYVPGCFPECTTIMTEANAAYTQNFSLSPADTGNVTGTVLITGGDEYASATISFRLAGQCGDGLQEIQVDSVNASNALDADSIIIPGEYDVTLPMGSYKLVSFSDAKTTLVEDPVVVTPFATTVTDILFP